MQSVEDLAQSWPDGAVVMITDGYGRQFRPAAFVFSTPDGMAWVEPGYADPMGSATPSFHRRAGTWSAVDVLDGDGWQLRLMPFYPIDADFVGEALVWFAGWLKAEGRSWAQERERVRALVADELA